MLNKSRIAEIAKQGRTVYVAQTGDEDLGPLKLLPGVWKNTDALNGRGWNMIALPFSSQPDSQIDYRLLMNQYNEELRFTLVDKGVPNRGIKRNGTSTNTDQRLVTLDYEQMIKQISADDRPVSGEAGPADLPIHHEPGLWLHMTNFTTDGLDIARLGTVPHGDSVLALGRAEIHDGPPQITPINGLPIGVSQNLEGFYLSPYKHFVDNPFKGVVTAPDFPGFNPAEPHKLLEAGVAGTVKRTTKLEVSTMLDHAGIVNIPFIVRQANAASMVSTFWILEMEEAGDDGKPRLFLQYSQAVLLDFFPRRDGLPGLIRWPHVSINTMEKIAEPEPEKAKMVS